MDKQKSLCYLTLKPNRTWVITHLYLSSFPQWKLQMEAAAVQLRVKKRRKWGGRRHPQLKEGAITKGWLQVTLLSFRRQFARCKSKCISIAKKDGEELSSESWQTLPATVRNPEYKRRKQSAQYRQVPQQSDPPESQCHQKVLTILHSLQKNLTYPS